MFLKIVSKDGRQYKEIKHQLYVYTIEEYMRLYDDGQFSFPRESSNQTVDVKRLKKEYKEEEDKPEIIIVYNYMDGGGGHLHVFKDTSVYLMNNDGKTVDTLF